MQAQAGSTSRISTLRLAALAAPSLALAALVLPLTVYLPNYYSSEIGVPLAMVGMAFMVVRLIDMAFDPLFGGVLDRTRTRFGRFRFWLALSAPGLMAACFMLFMAPVGVGAAYLWAGLLLLYGFFSVSTLSHMAWAAALTPDYNERSRTFAWWQAGNVVGMILVLMLPPLVEKLTGGDHAAGVRAMGWFIIALIPVTFGIALLGVSEPAAPPVVAATREGVGKSLGQYLQLFRIGNVQRILVADLFYHLPAGITAGLFFFFFEQVKGVDRGTAGVLLIFYFVGALGGAPLWAWLAKRTSKHRAMCWAGLMYVVVQSLTLVIPAVEFLVAAPVLFLAGLPFSAGPTLLRAMMADVGDEVRLDTGVDRTGLLYALLSGTIKIGTAAAVAISFGLLGAVGFVAQSGASNSPAALAWLSALFVGAPVAMMLVAVASSWNFKLTPERHAAIRERLAERDRQALVVPPGHEGEALAPYAAPQLDEGFAQPKLA